MTILEHKLLASPEVSYWLKDAIRQTSQRDPLDAVRDVELLLDVCKERLEARHR